MSYSIRSSPPRGALGDITCWNIDVDKWNKENRIPVFNNMWNYWTVKLTGRSYSTKDAEDTALRVVRDQWFGPKFSSERGTADSLSAQVVAAFDAMGKAIVAPDQLPKEVTFADGEGQAVLVTVKFAYRGSLTDVPWPVYSGDMFGPFCPKGVRAAVVAVLEAGTGAPGQDPCDLPGAWARDPKCIKKNLPDLPGVPWWMWAIGGVVTVAAVGPYVWPLVAPAARSWGKQVGRNVHAARERRKKK